MKYIFTFLLLYGFQTLFGQETSDLTPEERAYLFHIVKKSPILENNMGRFFEYKGPEVRLMNKELNFDSIESYIILHPESLFLRTSEISKCPKGILAEAANKMALWELNKALLEARQTDELTNYKTQYANFESLLIQFLPPAAIKTEDDEVLLNKKIMPFINPSLSFEDKSALLSSMNFLNEDEQLSCMIALNKAINTYVKNRSFEIYTQIGGEAETFENILIAAGDGSETSGLLNEREKDENNKWNKGLPKAVGLFPYESNLKAPERRQKTALESIPMPIIDFTTIGENRLTQMHFDVWGYNSKKQTTVVIHRNGLSYHLFGSAETRFLSPDSSFSDGQTFQSVIDNLKTSKIDVLYEKIYGKKGFDFQIKEAMERKDKVELEINKEEHNYSDITQNPITTSSKANRKAKKARKKAIKNSGKSGGKSGIPGVTTYSKKKIRRKEQHQISNLWGEFEYLTKLIKDLEKEKQNAIDLMAVYQRKMDSYTTAMGTNWARFTEEDGVYTFQDSTTFDIYTQEFTFKADTIKTPFEVQLIAIPDGPMGLSFDEVMLHVNMIDAKPGFDARLQFSANDLFPPNEWRIENKLLKDEDSVSIHLFFEALLNKKIEFQAIARGNGIGKWNGVQTVRSENSTELENYPGNSLEERLKNRMDTSLLRLRSTSINIDLNRGIFLEVNTFTDPVKSTIRPMNTSHISESTKYNLSNNDYLSALRAAQVISMLKNELNVYAGKFLTREEATIVIDRLNKKLDGTRISCGATSFKWQELLGK